MKPIPLLMTLLLAGCFAVPVQETTLHNSSGGTLVCKQTGQGLISYSVGKSHYEDCIEHAHAQGYQ